MSYRTIVLPQVDRLIGTWSLSTELFVDVQLRLRETLPANPIGLLVPSPDPGGGMRYHFGVVDPFNRFAEHLFRFDVYYHPDEQTLIVASGYYLRVSGYP